MKYEVLKGSHIKRNILIGALVVLMLTAIILNFTQAKYRTTQSIPLINGTINYTPYDFKIMAMFQENGDNYIEINQMPNENYSINEIKSYCTIDNTNKDPDIKLYTDDKGQHVFANLKKSSKCYLYFDENTCPLGDNICNKILQNKEIRTRTNFHRTAYKERTTNVIFEGKENNKKTYYFAGNPTDNWVKFAGFYWRIIRINSDGSIRLIYQGTSANTTGTGTQIGKSVFNSNSNNNAYLGYMYSEGEVHGLSKTSTIKSILDNWYQNNLNKYSSYIEINAGFCNDRSLTTGTGLGSDDSWYEPNNRMVNTGKPTFNCQETDDLFTVKESSIGNKSLTYPVGLITADEINFAGGAYYTENKEFYLYTGQEYWTISPRNYTSVAKPFALTINGLNSMTNGTTSTLGVRPVINIKADTQITGSGTSTDPFKVVGAS